MRLDYKIVPAEPAHVLELAGRLRKGDAAELQAAGLDAEGGVSQSYRRSIISRTAFVGDEIAGMWGIGGALLGRVGTPWLLTSPTIERAKMAFIREARVEVMRMLAIFPELRGFVDAAYDRAARLLSALGFHLGDMAAFGPHGALFREYWRTREP